MNQRQLICLLFVATGALLSSCEDYLDLKPDQSLVVPTTLQDLDALLNNAGIMNESTPNLGEVSAGDSYAAPGTVQYLNSEGRAIYTWQEELTLLSPIYVECWSEPYRMILYANIALEGLDEIVPSEAEQGKWDRIKGAALFYRSWAFVQLMAVFCEPYDPAAGDQMGIPLRLSSAVEQDLPRARLRTCYEQVIDDLQKAIQFLPRQSFVKTQPDQAAVLALLARVHLFKNDYQTALQYADAFLEERNELIDYSSLDTNAQYPFNQFNSEVIFHATIKRHLALPHAGSYAYVDSSLYRMYEGHDLRKQLFFSLDDQGLVSYNGSYDGSQDLFTGLATDEMYLTKAECLAHTGQTEAAINVLNSFLQTRSDPLSFVPVQFDSPEEALYAILRHRRKELLFRGIRWPDIKRLTVAGLFADTLKRTIEAETFLLPPGDKRYVLPIPQMVIERSGIAQNHR